jgi:DNA gyrase/topoisomerase IV subunit A
MLERANKLDNGKAFEGREVELFAPINKYFDKIRVPAISPVSVISSAEHEQEVKRKEKWGFFDKIKSLIPLTKNWHIRNNAAYALQVCELKLDSYERMLEHRKKYPELTSEESSQLRRSAMRREADGLCQSHTEKLIEENKKLAAEIESKKRQIEETERLTIYVKQELARIEAQYYRNTNGKIQFFKPAEQCAFDKGEEKLSISPKNKIILKIS